MKTTASVVGFVVATMLAIWGGAWVALVNGFPDWERRGQFGDMFGAVNALFSSLALVGVIVAIWVQKQELALQRQELEETRNELKRSAQAQEESSKALARQIKQQVLASRINAMSILLQSTDSEIDAALKYCELKTAEKTQYHRNHHDQGHAEVQMKTLDQRLASINKNKGDFFGTLTELLENLEEMEEVASPRREC